jgi:hypothetical protein
MYSLLNTIPFCVVSRAESFLLDLESFGLSVHPTMRTITYGSRLDESAIDYWLGSNALHFVKINVGGPLVAQHHPVQTVIKVSVIDGSFRLY